MSPLTPGGRVPAGAASPHPLHLRLAPVPPGGGMLSQNHPPWLLWRLQGAPVPRSPQRESWRVFPSPRTRHLPPRARACAAFRSKRQQRNPSRILGTERVASANRASAPHKNLVGALGRIMGRPRNPTTTVCLLDSGNILASPRGPGGARACGGRGLARGLEPGKGMGRVKPSYMDGCSPLPFQGK